MLITVLQLILWLFGIPILVGSLFGAVERQANRLVFQWISGQMLLWAVFQIVCVPMVLLEREFHQVVQIYALLTALLLLSAGTLWMIRRKKTKLYAVRESWIPQGWSCRLLWCLFFALLLFQLLGAVTMAYADGDDAFYVTLSGMAQDSNRMYNKIPYTGKTTVLDARHGLAPFPIWISFLCQVTGVEAVTMAHVVLAPVLIAMTYGIFYLLGRRLFGAKKEQLAVFLIFTEVLVLFGDYSFQTAENFLLARSRQGKAALANLIIPILIYLLFLLAEKLQEQKKMPLTYWLLMLSVMTTACLCSTLGALLAALLVGVTGLCAGICYRRIKPVMALALTCTPCVCYALIYLIL